MNREHSPSLKAQNRQTGKEAFKQPAETSGHQIFAVNQSPDSEDRSRRMFKYSSRGPAGPCEKRAT
jgi:hypothetical protein